MRIRGGGRVLVEVPKRERARAVGVVEREWTRDGFDAAPVRAVASRKQRVAMVTVVRELAREGKRRLEDDAIDRDAAALREVGRFLGRLSAEVVVELINHCAQRPPAERQGAMIALAGFVGALFVEYWAARRGQGAVARLVESGEVEAELGVTAEQALEAFIDFVEVTEGQPATRLVGTLYALG